MPASEPGPDGLEPRVRRRRGISVVWLIPLVAVALGAWLVWQTFQQRGPVVTVSFPTAAGLEAGKTQVRLRDVVVGTVRAVDLARDLDTVVTRIEMTPGAERYLTTGTRFWIVQPEIGLEGVTGLSTLLSGAYIAVDPGGGEPTREFEGLDRRPPIPEDAPGRRFVLASDRLGALRVGSPVFFSELPVGEITGFAIAERPDLRDGRLVCTQPEERGGGFVVEAYVRAPYADLVREGSHFFNASGIAFDISGRRVKVELQSLSALVAGGVAFAAPDDLDTAREAAAACRTFTLFSDAETARNAMVEQRRVPARLYFAGSIGGLEPGAPVTFRGIRVGEVTDIDLTIDVDQADDAFTIPVDIELFRGAITFEGAAIEGLDDQGLFQWLLDEGLRARLATTNILTGALEVQLDLYPDAGPAPLVREGEVIVLPTLPSSFDELRGSIQAVLAKLAALPLEQLAANLDGLLADARAVVGSPAIPAALEDAGATAAALRDIAGTLEGAIEPLARDARSALAEADQAMGALGTAAENAGRLTFSAEQLMAELRATARALRTFAEYLERNPEALIQGRRGRR